MKLDVKFTTLEAVVREMDARPIQWTSILDPLEPPGFSVELGTSGVEIPLAEVEVTSSGLLSNQRTLLCMSPQKTDH